MRVFRKSIENSTFNLLFEYLQYQSVSFIEKYFRMEALFSFSTGKIPGKTSNMSQI